MSVGTTAALVIGGIGAAGAIGSAAIGAHAATSAADQQAQAAQNALDFQKQEFATQQQNIAPWLEAGKTSLGSLMQGFQNGTFGPGSIPAFQAPSLQDARNSPGYQFELGQGVSAIQRSAAARGGLGSGSTLKGLQSFGTGLADSTYGDVFNRALSTYGAQLQGQTQNYNELAGVAGTGQQAANSINATGSQVAGNVGNLMTQMGNAQAAGTVGSANAWSGGIGGASNSILQSILLSQLGGGGGGASPIFNPGSGPGYGYGPAIPNTWTGGPSSVPTDPFVMSLGTPG